MSPKLITLLVILFFFILILIKNTGGVSLDLYVFSITMKKAILMLVVFITGLISGLLLKGS